MHCSHPQSFTMCSLVSVLHVPRSAAVEQAASALLSDAATALVQERSSSGLPRWLGGKESLPVLEIQV